MADFEITHALHSVKIHSLQAQKATFRSFICVKRLSLVCVYRLHLCQLNIHVLLKIHIIVIGRFVTGLTLHGSTCHYRPASTRPTMKY